MVPLFSLDRMTIHKADQAIAAQSLENLLAVAVQTVRGPLRIAGRRTTEECYRSTRNGLAFKAI